MNTTRNKRMGEHKIEMAARRKRQLARTSDRYSFDPSRNADASYRRSIWPEGKLANAGRMGA